MKIFYKLAQLLHEKLPANRRVYFLYTHKNGYERFNNGLKANTEISYWIYKALREHFPRVRFFHFQKEKPERIAQIRAEDVVVGHIGHTFMEASRRTRRLIAFNPWVGDEDHAQEGFNCCPKEIEQGFYNLASSLVLLTSEFNKREYIDKPRNYWHEYLKQKRVRIVHQPIDLKLFKRIKWDYTTHDFLYIGNKGHMKRVEEATRLVKECSRRLYLYGFDAYPKIDHLNEQQVNALPKQADFFIQPGLWEAQCVSILEAAARGFIPIVSEETGYPYQHPFLLKPRDFEYNIRKIKELLHTTPEERRQLADSLHSQLLRDLNHNNWKKLTDVIIEEVQLLFSH